MTRRLQLNRETLLRLDNGHLGGIVGGAVAVTTTCPTYYTCAVGGTCGTQTTVKTSITGATKPVPADF